jgi:hypothetical protein
VRTPFDRRAALGALASVTTLAVPVAVSASAIPDPIFSAIERHRGALTAFIAAIRRSDRTKVQADEDAVDSASTAEEDALLDALATPTTIEGLRAMLQYLATMKGGAVPEDAREVASLLLQSPILAT